MKRRNFLKLAGSVGATLTAQKSKAEEVVEHKEFVGVLTDTTRCIGCRSCEIACAKVEIPTSRQVVIDPVELQVT